MFTLNDTNFISTIVDTVKEKFNNRNIPPEIPLKKTVRFKGEEYRKILPVPNQEKKYLKNQTLCLNVDINGNVSESIVKTMTVKSWIPFFDEQIIGDKNSSVYDELNNTILIQAIKMGYDPPELYIFGHDTNHGLSLWKSSVQVICTDEDGHRHFAKAFVDILNGHYILRLNLDDTISFPVLITASISVYT